MTKHTNAVLLLLLSLLSTALFTGCPEPTEQEEYGPEMALDVLNPAGLYTSPSALSSVPPGAMLKADNLVVSRPGLMETRRGFERLTGAFPHADGVKSWVAFDGGIVGWGGGVLARLDTSSGTWTAYSGTYQPPAGVTRVKFAESASCLFFTTSAGVYRLDTITSTPVASGVPQALDGTASLTGSSGILGTGKAAASRYVWGTRDGNERLLLGAPSGRVTAVNTGVSSANIQHKIPIPSGITTNHFVQVYRSADVASTDSPSDEMRQVLEVFPTATDIANKYLTVTDVDSLRAGPVLYTSPNLGDGALAAKYEPPLCTDLAEWQGRLWCAATVQRHRIFLTLLSVDAASGGMQSGDSLYLSSDAVPMDVYTAGATENPAGRVFLLTPPSASVSLSQAIALTAQSLVRVINAQTSGAYRAFYVSSDSDVTPGKILIETRNLGAGPFFVSQAYGGNYWTPALRWNLTASSVSRSGSTVTVTTTRNHRLVPNQDVVLTNGTTNFPSGTKVVLSTPTSTTFTYTEAGAAVTDTSGRTYTTASPEIESDPSTQVHGIAYSPVGEPDAVPITHYDSAGNAEARILTMLPVGNALFFLKEDGLYRLTGDSPESFIIEPWDTTVHFVAPEAAVVMDGKAFALSEEGLITWTEASRPQPASIPIESTLRGLVDTARAQVEASAFAVPYDSDRRLLLWMPGSSASTSAEQVFVLNLLTGAWTRWTVSANTALVNPADGKLYVTPPADRTYRERKTGSSADFQGPYGEAIPADAQFIPQTAGAPEVGKLWGVVQFFTAGNVPTEATAYFSTEVVPTPESVLLQGANGSNPGVLETLPTPSHARSSSLTIGLQHAVVQEQLQLQGYSVRFRAYQGRR